MVEFRTTMGGYEVIVDGQPFGHIDKDGFFTDPTVVKDFMRVSSSDLREIADRVEMYRINKYDIDLTRYRIRQHTILEQQDAVRKGSGRRYGEAGP